MQDVSHRDHIHLRKRISEEIAGLKPQPPGDTGLFGVLLENRRDLWQIEPDALEMSVLRSNLDCEISLRCADIRKRAVGRPWELTRDGLISAAAEPGHCPEELLESGRIGVERFKQRQGTITSFVLGAAGSERLRQV